jgi:hypothetical protein
MRNIAIVLAGSFWLAGCESTVSNLWLPMEPTQESVAAPRRELTDAEKETISEAVALKLKDAKNREFIWAPLVVKPRGHVASFCGLVKGNDVDDEYIGFSKYNVNLTFDDRGKLAKVEVRSIAKSKIDEPPTVVDSVCMQDGYGGLPVEK